MRWMILGDFRRVRVSYSPRSHKTESWTHLLSWLLHRVLASTRSEEEVEEKRRERRVALATMTLFSWRKRHGSRISFYVHILGCLNQSGETIEVGLGTLYRWLLAPVQHGNRPYFASFVKVTHSLEKSTRWWRNQSFQEIILLFFTRYSHRPFNTSTVIG